MKADNLSFHLIPFAAWRTLEVQRYRALNFAKIANFVRKLLRFGGFFPQFFSPEKMRQKCFVHVTMGLDALCGMELHTNDDYDEWLKVTRNSKDT